MQQNNALAFVRGLILALRLVRMIYRAEAENHDSQTILPVSSVVTKL